MTLRMQLLSFFARVVGVAAFVWLAITVTGIGDAGDDLLRAKYYGVRGQRETSQRVILVAIDAPTVTAWGTAPWPEDRVARMFDAITKGGPTALGVVGDPRLIL